MTKSKAAKESPTGRSATTSPVGDGGGVRVPTDHAERAMGLVERMEEAHASLAKILSDPGARAGAVDVAVAGAIEAADLNREIKLAVSAGSAESIALRNRAKLLSDACQRAAGKGNRAELSLRGLVRTAQERMREDQERPGAEAAPRDSAPGAPMGRGGAPAGAEVVAEVVAEVEVEDPDEAVL